MILEPSLTNVSLTFVDLLLLSQTQICEYLEKVKMSTGCSTYMERADFCNTFNLNALLKTPFHNPNNFKADGLPKLP